MRKILVSLLLGLLVLVLAAPAFAENQAGTANIEPFTGFIFFDNKQHMDNGQLDGLRAGYNFTSTLGAEAFFGYDESAAKRTVGFERPIDFYHYGIDLLYHFMPDRDFVPFIAAGFGIDQSNGPSMPNANNHTIGAFDIGFGVKYFITDTVALRADARDVMSRNSGAVDPETGYAPGNSYDIFRSNRNNVELMIGLTFQLGTEKKAVAVIPPAADTTAPEVVCTSPDSGVTGVAIDRNITATFSKEMNRSTITTSAFTVKHGTTPVSGKVTYAGTTATFIPGSELEKGTTYTATMVAGVKDLAGNALGNSYVWSFTTIPPPPAMVALIMLDDTHFEFDKSTITKQGEEILDENIKILKANPKLRIRIAGYTSAMGTAEYNQKLSERRAESVKDYLVKGGIASDRLVTIGFGKTRPAEYEPLPDRIYSKEAKANMRVLFEVIVK